MSLRIPKNIKANERETKIVSWLYRNTAIGITAKEAKTTIKENASMRDDLSKLYETYIEELEQIVFLF